MSLFNIPVSTPVLAPVATAGWRNHAGHVLVYAEPLSRFGLYASLAIIYAWFGGMKFTEYEAQGLVPLVENSPLLSWFYALFSVRGFSTFLGFVELSIGLLIALRLASPIFSAAGGLLSAGLFVTTLSFMISTPGVVVPELGAPAITVAPGQFLLKDLGLLAVSFWIFVNSRSRRSQLSRLQPTNRVPALFDAGTLPPRKASIMSIRKRLTAAVLAIAIAAPIADFFWSKSMPQATTSWFQWTSARATAGQSQLTSLKGANEWLNSEPLTPEALRGKVVLIDFWTYTCINWLRTAPYVRAWEQKYRDQGLVVIGVHSPEFAFEKDIDNVRRAVKGTGDRLSQSRWTVTTRSGAASTTTTGRRYTSSMRRDASAITISAKARTRSPRGSFRSSWPRPEPPTSIATSSRSIPAASKSQPTGRRSSHLRTISDTFARKTSLHRAAPRATSPKLMSCPRVCGQTSGRSPVTGRCATTPRC